MKWEDLSMKDRTAIMAAAVRNGYTDIRSIKEAYANYQNQKLSTGNRYAEGGNKDNSQQESSMKNYTTWRMLLNTRKNIDPNDNTFDYEGYYNEDPDRAWNMLNEDANTHFEDKWKTVYHPTFSTLSFYSGLGHPVHNPSGAIGGTWGNNGQFEAYTVSDDLYRGPVSMNDRIDYLIDNSSDGVQLLESDGSLPYMKNNTFLGPILPNITVTNKNAYGGNLFERGGNVKGIKGFFNLLKKHGINVIETSGYRKGAVTKSGHASFHSMLDEWGNAKAQDFKPADGDWDKLRQRIYRNPELVQYMLDNNIGILEENTPEAQKRYGTRSKDGKGVWHAGYDTAAKRDRDNNIKLLQATYHPMQDITWDDVKTRKKQFELTPEEERLANTPTQTVFKPEYEDRNHPNYKESPLMSSIKLNPDLDKNINMWNMFINMLEEPSQDNQDDLDNWINMLMAAKAKPTTAQQEPVNLLFAPQGNDYMYHGLNFAAYGGKVNKFDGYGNSHLDAVKLSNPGRDGYYIADGAGTRKEITYEQALELAKNNPNLAVNYYKDNVGGTGRLHWDENQNLFVDNNEYFGKELDNVDIVKIVDRPTRQLTDAIPISNPVLEYRPGRIEAVDFTNTDQNMFHRRNVARADAEVREALSSDVVDHVYDFMMPSTWAGVADKLFDHDKNGNLRYNFFTDFNKVFNPAYDNQGFVGLVGADEWAYEHPEATGYINTGIDFALPFGIKGIKGANLYNIADRRLKGNNFTSRLILDTLNPEVSVWRATKNDSYPWTGKIESNRISQLTPIAEDAKDYVLGRVQQSLMLSPHLKPDLTMLEIARAQDLADNVPILWVDHSWYRNSKTDGAYGLTSTSYLGGPPVIDGSSFGTAPNPNNVTISYPLFKGARTNIMYSPQDLQTIGNIGEANLNAAIYHEPVHAAQYILYPTFLGDKGIPVFKPFKNIGNKVNINLNQRTNLHFIADDVAKSLAAEPSYGEGLTYSGTNPNVEYIEIDNSFPWDRMWTELDAEIQGFKAKNKYPALTRNLSQEQKRLLVKHIGDKFDLDYRKAENLINRNALYGF